LDSIDVNWMALSIIFSKGFADAAPIGPAHTRTHRSATMSAISAVQCRFLAGAKVSAARKTVRARAAVVAPVAKFGYVAVPKIELLATLCHFSASRTHRGSG
jgi:hypothetical protein|tara:strand:- start:26447 stop:26752 length:306 start_codon:yes stop_codon:yes gene_type:complete